jgi:hypothetical protein
MFESVCQTHGYDSSTLNYALVHGGFRPQGVGVLLARCEPIPVSVQVTHPIADLRTEAEMEELARAQWRQGLNQWFKERNEIEPDYL